VWPIPPSTGSVLMTYSTPPSSGCIERIRPGVIRPRWRTWTRSPTWCGGAVAVSIRAAGIPITSSMAAVRGVGDVVGGTKRLPGSADHADRRPDLVHRAVREWAERTGRTLYPVHR